MSDKPVELFSHKKTVKMLAEKYGLPEKKVNTIVNAFFGAFGINYFIRRFVQVYIPRIGRIKCTKRTWYVRQQKKYRFLLRHLRNKDNTRWEGRDTGF